MNGIARRYFEDVHEGEALPPVVKTITFDQLIRYAGASGDFNPIHTNPDAARAAGLDGVIAHGLLNMAFLGQLMTDWAGDPGALRLLRCRFSRVVRPGDTVTARGTVTEKTVEGGHLVSCKIWVENQAGETVLSGGIAVVALPARSD